MFTHYSANTHSAQPALVNAIEQGLRAESNGVQYLKIPVRMAA